jgi:hypothetical protein
VRNIVDLIDKHSTTPFLVLHLQCGLLDVGYMVSVIDKKFLSHEKTHVWDKICGLDAGFNFSACGTVDYPDPYAGIRAGLCVNRLGGEFLYYDRSSKGHIGTGSFVNNNYFDFQLDLPNRTVRDILMKLLVLDRVSDKDKNTFGIRIDIVNLIPQGAAAVSFAIARVYI